MSPEDALKTWLSWQSLPSGKPTLVRPLKGLTNRSWLVSTDSGAVVLRLNNPNEQSLGIDRLREAAILQALSSKGMTPLVLYQNHVAGILVTEYRDGLVYSASTLPDDKREVLRGVIAQYQNIGLDLPRFNYFEYLLEYAETVRSLDCFETDWEQGWQLFLAQLELFQQGVWTPVLTHHDLQGDNVILCEGSISLIDWEYAAYGHPAFDAVSAGLCPDGDVTEEDIRLLKQILFWLNRFWFAIKGSQQVVPSDSV